MKKLFVLLFLMSELFASAQTFVPYLKKNGKYIFVEASTMKPVLEKEFDAIPGIILAGFEKDNSGNVIIPPAVQQDNEYTFIESGFESFESDGWYGFMNREKKIVVQPIYQRVSNFKEGLAFVQIEGMKGGYIDTTGKLIFSGDAFMDCKDFSDGLAKIRNNTQEYFVDKNGTCLLQFVNGYEEGKPNPDLIKNCKVATYKDRNIYPGPHLFQEDLVGVDLTPLIERKACYHADWDCAFFDKSGRIVIQAKPFQYYRGFYQGFAILETCDGAMFYIDKNGNEFIEK